MKITIAAAFATLVLTAGAAQAHIRCNGAYQVVNGTEIATPYCQDANLARLAQQQGLRVTADQLRNDVGSKRGVCRVIGTLPSARSACASLMDN